MHETDTDDERLSEAVVTLGEALGDEAMLMLSVGDEGDRGVVLVAQGDTAKMLLKLVEGDFLTLYCK
jgi:hypothetical protein